ncbi:hypothetical protein M885DRAFT_514879 [Pelagophyceae sp. CCMP2097]|nr:hypothetical protein M885DRAFT_514879 [Pelagophyceae sp. CCMP2097]
MGPDTPGGGAFHVGPPSLPLRRLSSDHAPVGLPARRAAMCPSLRRLAELCPQASSRRKNPSGCCLLQATSSNGRFEALVSLRQIGSDWRKWVQQGGPKPGGPGAAPVHVPLKPGKALGRFVRGKIVLRPKHAGARPSCRRYGASSRHTTTTRRRLSTLSLQPVTSRGACGSQHTSARSSAPRLGRTRWPRSGRTRRSTSRSATNSP